MTNSNYEICFSTFYELYGKLTDLENLKLISIKELEIYMNMLKSSNESDVILLQGLLNRLWHPCLSNSDHTMETFMLDLSKLKN